MSPTVFRRIQTFRRTSWKNGGPLSSSKAGSFVEVDEKHIVDDDSSRTFCAVMVSAEESIQVSTFQVKRVDCFYSPWSKSWKYRAMTPNTINEPVYAPNIPLPPALDQWKNYGLVFVRVVPRERYLKPTCKYIINNNHVKTVCQDVIRSWPGINWDSNPLELSPRVLLAFYTRFCIYRDALQLRPAEKRSLAENNLLAAASLIIDGVTQDFEETLTTLHGLVSKREITFNFLYTLFIPGTLVVGYCAVTQLPRLFRLTSVESTGLSYTLQCESIDITDEPSRSGAPVDAKIGKVKNTIVLHSFSGTLPITELAAYPIMFHPNEAKLREQVVQRGKKWLELMGIHHMQYDGPAVVRSGSSPVTHIVKSRIMVDRTSFRHYNPTHPFALPGSNSVSSSTRKPAISYANDILVRDALSQVGGAFRPKLTDEELLLTPAVVYGFSFSDKTWFEFNVNLVKDVEWNDDAFRNLVIPMEKKNLLRSVVDAHHRGIGVDDFVKDKGQGLIVNLSGPPGVGKTFTAEATSEHVRKPLYVVGSGDLGTSPETLESNLQRIFHLATVWKATLLIDEADVFLEKRTHHDLGKNAIVAVFLRHIEYYRGILFLTTNRLAAFDPAFLSRVHVALHFSELTEQSRQQVWTAFINKLGRDTSEDITANQIRELAKRQVNGRQIKNAVRTGQSLAVAKSQKVKYAHLVEALDAMDQFMKESGIIKVVKVVPDQCSSIYYAL